MLFRSATLLSYTLHVADYLAPEAISLTNLMWLKSYFYLGDSAHDESLLRVAVVGQDGELVSLNGGTASAKYRLSYHPRTGYRSIKL